MKQKHLTAKFLFSGIITPLLLLTMSLAACKKEPDNTPPDLEFIEVNSFDVSPGDLLSFSLRVNGNRGALQDSIWVKAFTNACPQFGITIPYILPRTRDINIKYLIYRIDPSIPIWNVNLCPGVDTTIFQFWVKDIQGNIKGPVGPDRPVLIRTP
jgi:hypothetical protein